MTFTNSSLDRAQWITMSSFDTSTLSGSYQILNTGGLPSDVKILIFYNSSSNPVSVSADGTNLIDVIPAGGRVAYELQTNHADNSAYGAGTLYAVKGMVFYGKGTASAGAFNIGGIR